MYAISTCTKPFLSRMEEAVLEWGRFVLRLNWLLFYQGIPRLTAEANKVFVLSLLPLGEVVVSY